MVPVVVLAQAWRGGPPDDLAHLAATLALHPL